MNRTTKRKFKLNEKGQLTMDFLFACVLVTSVAVLLGALTFALTLTEVVQYVSFSAARNYFAADYSPTEQQDAASSKAGRLIKQIPFLSAAQGNNWIAIGKQKAGHMTDYEIDGDQVKNSQFTGYVIEFSLPLLDIKLPLLGRVVEFEGGQGPKTRVTSFLMREPSFTECKAYVDQAYEALLDASGKYKAVLNHKGLKMQPNAYQAILDNGC